MTVYVKTTADGRKVEVIDGWLCLGGVRETDTLVPLIEHQGCARCHAHGWPDSVASR
jgi:hypothetical protein